MKLDEFVFDIIQSLPQSSDKQTLFYDTFEAFEYISQNDTDVYKLEENLIQHGCINGHSGNAEINLQEICQCLRFCRAHLDLSTNPDLEKENKVTIDKLKQARKNKYFTAADYFQMTTAPIDFAIEELYHAVFQHSNVTINLSKRITPVEEFEIIGGLKAYILFQVGILSKQSIFF